MAEQGVDLEIKIDESLWWNLSTHPSKLHPSLYSQVPRPPSTSQKPDEPATIPAPPKTVEEVVQQQETFDKKLQDLYLGNFQVTRETRPSHHLLVNFEDTHDIPIVLAIPDFNKKSIQDHFDALEKPKEQPAPEPKPADAPILDLYDVRISQKDRSENLANKESVLPTKSVEEFKKELIDLTQKTEPPVEPTHSVQREESARPHDAGIQEERPRLPVVEPKKVPQSQGDTKPEPSQAVGLSTAGIEEPKVAERVIEEPRVARKVEERPWKRVKFDGQVLANRLVRRIALDSFHYVRLNSWKEEPKFLLNRFLQRRSFERGLESLDVQHGENYMFRSYFSEGILRSSYLMNRYFRNPVLLKY